MVARTADEWRNLVKGYTAGHTPEAIEAAVAYLMQHPDSCVWHAAAVVSNRLDRCHCQPCTATRQGMVR